MKKIVAIFGVLALSACSTGSSDGDDSGVDLTPTTPSTTMNAEFGTGLNALRMGAGEETVFYDATVGLAAQTHANDMYDNDYLSIFMGPGNTQDMGDTLNDLGLSWSDIGQMVAQGDFDTDSVLTEWETNGSPDGSNGGGTDELTFSDYELFGLAKAGEGADSRWVLLLVNPS